MPIVITTGELDRPDVGALLAVHVAAMHRHSPPDACHVLPASALAEPAITFFTARLDGRLLGFGALKALGNDEGEIKSMRTDPLALGKGVGRAILHALIREARSRNYVRLRLETGRSADFAAANALYDRAGFIEGEAFGGYPPSDFTRFLRLDL